MKAAGETREAWEVFFLRSSLHFNNGLVVAGRVLNPGTLTVAPVDDDTSSVVAEFRHRFQVKRNFSALCLLRNQIVRIGETLRLPAKNPPNPNEHSVIRRIDNKRGDRDSGPDLLDYSRVAVSCLILFESNVAANWILVEETLVFPPVLVSHKSNPIRVEVGRLKEAVESEHRWYPGTFPPCLPNDLGSAATAATR